MFVILNAVKDFSCNRRKIIRFTQNDRYGKTKSHENLHVLLNALSLRDLISKNI